MLTLRQRKKLYCIRMGIYKVNPNKIKKVVNHNEVGSDFFSVTDFVIGGDWDTKATLFKDRKFYKDVKKGMISEGYKNLYNSIKNKGYDVSKVSHHIQIAVGREGNCYFLMGNID